MAGSPSPFAIPLPPFDLQFPSFEVALPTIPPLPALATEEGARAALTSASSFYFLDGAGALSKDVTAAATAERPPRARAGPQAPCRTL